MLTLMFDFPQTIAARIHSSCTKVDGKTELKSPRSPESGSQSPILGWNASFSQSPFRKSRPTLMSGGAEVYTMCDTQTTRLRPHPPESQPTRQLSTLMHMDPDVPGMQTYNSKLYSHFLFDDVCSLSLRFRSDWDVCKLCPGGREEAQAVFGYFFWGIWECLRGIFVVLWQIFRG